MMKPAFLFARKVFSFYYDGFKNISSWGKKVWIIIIVKLFLIFFVLKLFFFPDFMKKHFENDRQRSEYVLEKLTNTTDVND